MRFQKLTPNLVVRNVAASVLMQANGQNTLVPAGDGIRILPRTSHQIRNPTASAVHFLVISPPPSHGDRIDR